MFEIKETTLPGCRLLLPVLREDARGRFVKSFHADFFAANGMADVYREQYYSVSGARVLRGLHFQVPPHDHAKLVLCLAGEVFDAVVDLRVGSPTYGRHAHFRLTADRGEELFIPSGFAHGFYVLSQEAIVLYSATTVYAAQYDTGIAWNSAGVDWPHEPPILSEKDEALPALSAFRSPFSYRERAAAVAG